LYIYSRYDTRKICIKHNVYQVGHDILTVKSRKKFGTNNGGGEKKYFCEVLRTIFLNVRPILYFILLWLLLLFLIQNLRHTSLRAIHYVITYVHTCTHTWGWKTKIQVVALSENSTCSKIWRSSMGISCVCICLHSNQYKQ